MVKLRTVMLTSVATFSMASVHAACTAPDEVSVPDGSQASMEEMLAAQTAVKTYMADMEAYLSCLETEANAAKKAAADEETIKATEAAHSKEHNSAVDGMERVANSFNEQIRAYKAKNP